MTERILQILDNVRYWDTCPDDYKRDIEIFLETQNEALRIHDVVGRSEQLLAFKEWECDKCKLPWDAEAMLTAAKAEAEANRLKQQTITPMLLQLEWINKWNGKLPETMLGDKSNTMIGIK